MTTHRSNRLALAGVAAIALSSAACAPGISVGVNTATDLKPAVYRTFTWDLPDQFPAGDPRLDNNVVFRDHLQGAIARELKGRGFMSTDGKPDLLVHYHASIRQQVDMNGADQKKGYEVGYDSAARPYLFDEGTLTIDVIDAHTNRLVWRGWAERSLDGAINDQAWLERRIDDTVARILTRMPGKL